MIRDTMGLLTPADKVLILILFLISMTSMALLGTSSERGDHATIHSDMPSPVRVDLSLERKLSVAGPLGNTWITVRDNSIYVSSSECPAKKCMKQGIISKVGEIIVCAPNRIIISIEGKTAANFDAVTG